MRRAALAALFAAGWLAGCSAGGKNLHEGAAPDAPESAALPGTVLLEIRLQPDELSAAEAALPGSGSVLEIIDASSPETLPAVLRGLLARAYLLIANQEYAAGADLLCQLMDASSPHGIRFDGRTRACLRKTVATCYLKAGKGPLFAQAVDTYVAELGPFERAVLDNESRALLYVRSPVTSSGFLKRYPLFVERYFSEGMNVP